ncbi:MAG: hypothetical protein WC145_05895 [Aliarcobacter sp.]
MSEMNDEMAVRAFRRRLLPRLGKIGLGERVRKGDREHPREVSYFRVPEEVAAVYGPQPTELDVLVPTPRIAEWFPVRLKSYGSGGHLKCTGDGEMARRFDEGTGQWREINCDHRDCPWYREGQCQEIGNLQLVLPRVSMRGVYQIDTSSFYGMNAVYDEWEFFSGIFVAHTGAPEALPSVPFKLVRRMEQIEYWDGREGKRRTTSHPILHLVAPDWRIDDLLTIGARYRQMRNPQGAPALPASSSYSGDSEEEIELPDDVEIEEDLVPGAAPEGPDLGQRTAWAAIEEAAEAAGMVVAAFEEAACRQVTSDTTVCRFADLSRTEAEEALAWAARQLETRKPRKRNGSKDRKVLDTPSAANDIPDDVPDDAPEDAPDGAAEGLNLGF